MTGKLADTVMSVRNGEQIARKYQPVVYNPSTAAQVAQRAKMKLISQLSAIFAPVIAIPRRGPVSSRNLFTKKNFSLLTFDNDTAAINLSSIQLTESVVGIPYLVFRQGETDLTVELSAAIEGIDRMVYAEFQRLEDGSLEYVDSVVVNTPGVNERFTATFPLAPIGLSENDNLLYLAYGIRFNSESARVNYDDLNVLSAEMVANLIANRTLTESDVTLTKTVGLYTHLSDNREVGKEAKKK